MCASSFWPSCSSWEKVFCIWSLWMLKNGSFANHLNDDLLQKKKWKCWMDQEVMCWMSAFSSLAQKDQSKKDRQLVYKCTCTCASDQKVNWDLGVFHCFRSNAFLLFHKKGERFKQNLWQDIMWRCSSFMTQTVSIYPTSFNGKTSSTICQSISNFKIQKLSLNKWILFVNPKFLPTSNLKIIYIYYTLNYSPLVTSLLV